MTSVAHTLVAFVAAMVFIVTMDPPGSHGCPAATDTKVAFIAGDVEIMAIGTIVRRLIAMKLRAFFVEPILAQDMIDAFAVAIVTYRWFIAIGSI